MPLRNGHDDDEGDIMSTTWDGLVTTRTGWTCPECKTVYSPDVRSCECAKVTPPLRERIHFGGAMIRFPAAHCTCPQSWHAVIPPPPCPVHGQAEMLRVTC